MSLQAQEWDIKHCFLNGFWWSEFTEGPVMDKAQLASCTDRCTAILKAEEEKQRERKMVQIGWLSGE